MSGTDGDNGSGTREIHGLKSFEPSTAYRSEIFRYRRGAYGDSEHHITAAADKVGNNASVAIMKAGTSDVIEAAKAYAGTEMLEGDSSFCEP